MSPSELRPANGRSAVRLERDELCVFDRNGIYQARIRLGNGRYLWRSLKTAPSLAVKALAQYAALTI